MNIRSPKSPVSPDGISGPAGNEKSEKSGISLDTGLSGLPSILAREPIRILLGEAASRALLDAGQCFVIAGRASHPDPGDRIALHLVPIDKETGDKLCGVLQGTHRVIRK